MRLNENTSLPFVRPRYRQALVLAGGGLLICALSPLASAIGLSTAYEKALQYDSELAAAQAGRQIVSEDVNRSRARLLPQLGATAGAEYTDQSVDSDGSAQSTTVVPGGDPVFTQGAGRGDDSYKTYNAGVSVSQALYDPSAFNELEAARKTSSRAEEEFRQAVLTLTFSSAEAYFSVLRAIDELSTSRRAEAAFERQWEQAKERFDVGLIAITEVQESRAIFDAGKVDRINAEGQLDIALEDLERLTGLSVEEINLLAEDYPILDPTKVPVSEWEELAYANNPELLAAALAVQAAEELLEARRADLYPTVNATASYGYSQFAGQSPIDTEVTQGTIGLNLNLPLYLGGGARAGIRQANYQYIQAEEIGNTVRRNVRLQVRSLYRNLRTNVEAIQARQQQIISSESALEATRAGYDVGTRNVVEVLQAESAYYQALSDFANARYDYIINSLSLLRAAGRLGEDDIRQLDQWLNRPTDISSL
ncbi:TolC family outer membrane protein [Allohahella marinimesophila]|uniref:TolC family outer membrane protein n=1 Tax=Allohahella marinimesophila TaxID=1054972 RepID=A0ABP7PJ65_9GAMM